jgi:DNA repair protein RadA
MCFQLAVNATMPEEKGGLDGHVIVIDTENTFRPKRIDQIAKAQGLDIDEVNEKIHVARAFNAAHQMLLLEEKAAELAKEVPVRLVIVDSLVAHFRAEYIGRGNLGERQGMLNKHMHDLLKFADVNNAVIAVTNQVITNPGQLFGDPTKPVGGNIVGHTSTYRCYIRKGKNGKRVVRMIDSPESPDEEVVISVGEEGIRDG